MLIGALKVSSSGCMVHNHVAIRHLEGGIYGNQQATTNYHQRYYYMYSEPDSGMHTYPKIINTKINDPEGGINR